MRVPWINIGAVAAAAVALALLVARNSDSHAAHRLLNVSYDPTRELYQDINPRFVEKYTKETGTSVTIDQSHAGSSYQAKLVGTGKEKADVVTLGLPSGVAGKPKPPSELKDHVVQVRLTEAQYQDFETAARAAGHSL